MKKLLLNKQVIALTMAIFVLFSLLATTIHAYTISIGDMQLSATNYTYYFTENSPYPFNQRTGISKHFLFNLKGSNQDVTSYCIDYVITTATGEQYQATNSYPNHTAEQKRLLNIALLYGYNDYTRNTYGCNEVQARIGTQAMIWVISHGYYGHAREYEVVQGLTHENPNARIVYDNIKKNMEYWDKDPDFMKEEFTLEYNEQTGIYECVLTFKSLEGGNAYDWDFNTNDSRVTVEVASLDSIKLTANEPIETVTLTAKRTLAYSSQGLINASPEYWLNGNARQPQVALKIGNDIIQKKIETKGRSIAVGNITVHKQAEALTGFEELENGTHQPIYELQNLSNTTYEVYRANTNELVDVLVTDEQGKATSINLNLGSYYLQEVDCPEGIQIDPEPIYFDLTSQGQSLVVNKPIDTYNERQKVKVYLAKRMEVEANRNNIF